MVTFIFLLYGISKSENAMFQIRGFLSFYFLPGQKVKTGIMGDCEEQIREKTKNMGYCSAK